MKKIIFNSSMPRSGSELLQVVFHQNPKIYGSPTSPVLEYQFGARLNYELPEVKAQNPQLMFRSFIDVCEAIPQAFYKNITDRPIICDKSRGWLHYYEWVEQWNPHPKMICMVRDLRSIVASFERIYRKNRHSPQCIDDPAKMQNLTAEQRVVHWLNTQPIGLGLQRIQDVFQRKIADKILFIRYEDFCASPNETMKKIYEYIEEPYFEHDFNKIKKQIEENDSVFGIFGSHSVKEKVEPSKPSDWSDVIPQPIANEIKKSFSWYFNIFNY